MDKRIQSLANLLPIMYIRKPPDNPFYNPNQSTMKISTPLFHGLALGTALLIWSIANHFVTVNSIPAVLSSIAFFLIPAFAFMHLIKERPITFSGVIIPLLIAATSASLLVATGNLLYTLTHPDYSTTQVEHAHEKWEASHYENHTETQIENTTTFTNAWQWSLTLLAFHFTTCLAVALIIVSAKYAQQRIHAHHTTTPQ